ncbi:MAG: SDR family oxidoreductase [bacterium]|nr:SDR family oxidoreductase [bacterium]
MDATEDVAKRNERVFGTQTPVAFVTGSASPRVGRVIADYLEANAFQTIRHGRSKPNPSDGKQRFALSGLVQDEPTVEGWLREIVDRFGRIDVVVNSAAIWDPKKLEDTTAEDFEHFFRVNCLGVALVCKHFGLQMCRQASGGAILNIGDWAIARPYRDFAAYFPSKGGLPAMTRSMAVEFAERNSKVRVNAVLPGPVLLAEGTSQEKREKIISECLLRREGTAKDVAEAVHFLATAPFITGVCLPVDGGRSIYSGSSADAIAHPNYHPS